MNFQGEHAPELWRLILTFCLILTLGSLAAGAGIGGGGLFVPIYAVLLNVGAKPAVPLSKCTILGAAIGNYVSIGFGRHPNADRPLIDYETSTFMQAGELLGVTFGVLLNLMLPEIIIMIFLMLLLSYNSIRTLRKGRDKFRKETIAFALEERRGQGSDSGSLDALSPDGFDSSDNLVGMTEIVTIDGKSHPIHLTAEYLQKQHTLAQSLRSKSRFELHDFLMGIGLDQYMEAFTE